MSAEAIILLVSGLLAFVGALVATTATAVIYINNSLSANRQLLYVAIKEVTTTIVAKLEYHEQHDDRRFEARDKRIWALEMWKAVVTKQIPTEFPGDNIAEH